MQRDPAAWVFTSATLAVGGQLRALRPPARDRRGPHRALGQPLRLPPSGPLVRAPGDARSRRSGLRRRGGGARRRGAQPQPGRAFLLFTSHRALREAADRLAPRIPYPILIQGSAPRAELLERFRELGNAVLLGTASFWEGVDVRGEALSCVIIDKLPFASPGDPVLAARIDALRREGGNPFRDYQLPQAVIALKQGPGASSAMPRIGGCWWSATRASSAAPTATPFSTVCRPWHAPGSWPPWPDSSPSPPFCHRPPEGVPTAGPRVGGHWHRPARPARPAHACSPRFPCLGTRSAFPVVRGCSPVRQRIPSGA
jgi:hypothetical protein